MSGSKSTIKKKRVLLKKLAKHDAMWHPDSRLVFKSKKDKLVIGRLDEENKLVSADELTLELCEQWNFKMDPTLVEDDDSDSEDMASAEEPAPESPAGNSDMADAAEKAPNEPSSEAKNNGTDRKVAKVAKVAEVAEVAETREIDGEGLTLLRDVGNYIVTLENQLRAVREELGEKKVQLREKDDEVKKLREKHEVIKRLFS